jgi:hypothetical protein
MSIVDDEPMASFLPTFRNASALERHQAVGQFLMRHPPSGFTLAFLAIASSGFPHSRERMRY